jgi:hypothetical protein
MSSVAITAAACLLSLLPLLGCHCLSSAAAVYLMPLLRPSHCCSCCCCCCCCCTPSIFTARSLSLLPVLDRCYIYVLCCLPYAASFPQPLLHVFHLGCLLLLTAACHLPLHLSLLPALHYNCTSSIFAACLLPLLSMLPAYHRYCTHSIFAARPLSLLHGLYRCCLSKIAAAYPLSLLSVNHCCCISSLFLLHLLCCYCLHHAVTTAPSLSLLSVIDRRYMYSVSVLCPSRWLSPPAAFPMSPSAYLWCLPSAHFAYPSTHAVY